MDGGTPRPLFSLHLALILPASTNVDCEYTELFPQSLFGPLRDTAGSFLVEAVKGSPNINGVRQS